MASPIELLSELAEIVGFASLREADGPCEAVANMTQVLCSKIIRLRSFETVDACNFAKALQKHNLRDDLKKMIQASVDKRLQKSASVTPPAWRAQLLTTFENFLREADWLVLEDRNSSHQVRTQRLWELMAALGLWQLEELTVRSAVGLLLSFNYSEPPSASIAYSHVQDFKKGWEAFRPQRAGTFIAKSPVDAEQLPQDLYQKAYNENPPAPRVLPQLGSFTRQVPLRSSSKSLRAEPKLASAIQHPPDAVTWGQLNQMFNGGQMFPNAAQGINLIYNQGQSSRSNALPLPLAGLMGLQFSSASATALPLPALPAPARSPTPSPTEAEDLPEPVVPKPKQSLPASVGAAVLAESPIAETATGADGRITSEQYEAVMMEALENAKKRKSAKEKGTSKKKPAAASKKQAAVSKKPAAAPSSTSYAVSWDPSDLNKNVHRFTSKHYHAAVKAAAKDGLSKDEQKLAGQEAYKAAKCIWDAKQ
jgi:hypothetical protein